MDRRGESSLVARGRGAVLSYLAFRHSVDAAPIADSRFAADRRGLLGVDLFFLSSRGAILHDATDVGRRVSGDRCARIVAC